MRVPWTARRSNQSILKEISPEYSLEGLMLKLKQMMQRTDSLEKTLMLREIREMQIKATMRYHFVSTRIAIIKKKKKVKSVEENVEKLELSSFSGGDIKWFSHCRK